MITADLLWIHVTRYMNILYEAPNWRSGGSTSRKARRHFCNAVLTQPLRNATIDRKVFWLREMALRFATKEGRGEFVLLLRTTKHFSNECKARRARIQSTGFLPKRILRLIPPHLRTSSVRVCRPINCEIYDDKFLHFAAHHNCKFRIKSAGQATLAK